MVKIDSALSAIRRASSDRYAAQGVTSRRLENPKFIMARHTDPTLSGPWGATRTMLMLSI
jgi:hypothetical protein